MSLGERIGTHRKNLGLSQEQLAELVGVSRQAVTKWETGQSAPSTEHLLKLAAALGTTVDILLASGEPGSAVPADSVPCLSGRAERGGGLRASPKRNIGAALGILAGYLAIYLLGRIGYGRGDAFSVTGWLFTTDVGRLPYLYGWLLTQNLFGIATLLSVLPALWGKYRFSCTTLAAFGLGLLLGEWLGVFLPAPPTATATTAGPSGAASFSIPSPWGLSWRRWQGRTG